MNLTAAQDAALTSWISSRIDLLASATARFGSPEAGLAALIALEAEAAAK